MTRTIFDVLFVACLFAPAAVVVLGALSLAWPRHSTGDAHPVGHRHAHA